MLDLTKKLNLTVAHVRELSTNTCKEIAGSPETKGVRGIDKRKYLIDLMRLHPRDCNYPDKITQSASVIREQLLKIYEAHQIYPSLSVKAL